MIWETFQAAAPEIALPAEERFTRTRVALLGTLRRDGSPRISPIEPIIAHGHLLLGMMWHSLKALDLLRDPRCTLHSAVTSVEGTDGECKLHGRALEAQEAELRERQRRALVEHWGASAPASFHIFSLEIESAAFIAYDSDAGQMLVKRWNPQLGLRETRRPYP